MTKVSVHLATAAALLCAPGCVQVEKVTGDNASTSDTVPDEVQRVFDDRCAVSGCHDGTTSPDLRAAASNGIIDGSSDTSPLSMVELGNVSGSYLAVKMLAAPPPGVERVGGRMPQGGDFSDEALLVDMSIVIGWIAGAELGGGDDGGNDDVADDGMDDGSNAQGCSIFEVAPGVGSPVQAGTDANTLPTEIGTVLDLNCGCHYATDLVNNAPAYTGPVNFRTHGEFQATYAGSTPAYAGLRTYDAVLDRVADESNPMPPTYYCMLEGGGVITDADRTLLIDWLVAGAPDAPTWAGDGGTGG